MVDITNSCLHCAIEQTVNEWFERHGRRIGDDVLIDITLAIDKVTQVVVELAQMPEERSKRRGAMKYAHDCLDAHLKAKQVGHPVPVTVKEIPDG